MQSSIDHVNFYRDDVTTSTGGQIHGWIKLPHAYLRTSAILPTESPVLAQREDTACAKQAPPVSPRAVSVDSSEQPSNPKSAHEANHGMAYDALNVYLQHFAFFVETMISA